MFPFIEDKSKWPYAHDVEYFDDLPNRQPSLLFAGLAYREPKYIALWRTLPPDPKTAEIIRNFPDTPAGAVGKAGVESRDQGNNETRKRGNEGIRERGSEGAEPSRRELHKSG